MDPEQKFPLIIKVKFMLPIITKVKLVSAIISTETVQFIRVLIIIRDHARRHKCHKNSS